MKPERLSLDPNSPTVAKEWRHWRRTFENYLASLPAEEGEGGNAEVADTKLKCLINSVDFNVFDFIEDCQSYETAINVLNSLFIKAPSTVFARHVLATTKQQAGQTLHDFLQTLRALSKDCNFQAVTAEDYRQQMVRDAFINGLASSAIRQRLLENRNLTLDQAYDQANALDCALRQSLAYDGTFNANVVAVAPKSPSKVSNEMSHHSTEAPVLAVSRGSPSENYKKTSCFFCGNPSNHPRKWCPARNAICFNCRRKGHFSKVCRGKAQTNSTPATLDQSICVIQSAPPCLMHAIMTAAINSHEVSVIVDSGSSLSYINKKTAALLDLTAESCKTDVSLATSDQKLGVLGFCTVDLNIRQQFYTVKLGVVENLCSDVLLGSDFQGLHKRVIFEYHGSKPDFVVNNLTDICSSMISNVSPVNLFKNLLPGCRPIATKSRRFNADDRSFIQEEIDKLKKEGVIRSSSSPWRAQTLVVKNKVSGKKRLCIDYSQTINLFTLLDAYPLPRIDDLINGLASYKIFSTFDLKSAYHQIPIDESDKPYTAFEACGKLWEFNSIPFGVTNGVPQFQRVMDALVEEDGLKGTFPYLDNVTVGGNCQKEHDENVSQFLQSIRKRGLRLNQNKTISSVSCINILGYSVGNGIIKPDPERLKPLLELPAPHNAKSLKRVLGMFAYYAKWIANFSNRIERLKNATSFPLNVEAVRDFEKIKEDIAKASLAAIDENLLFIVECDASEVAVSATLNQGGRPVAFMSRTFHASERHYPAVEKEATAIIEAVRKWNHFLARGQFTLVTDQRSVAFMFDRKRRSKIKNNKIQSWRLELASLAYNIHFRPGKDNIAPDTLTRAFCVNSHNRNLQELHENLCHPGISRLAHYVRAKNLPFSVEDVKKVCLSCQVCAELKPRFCKPPQNTLIKATQPFERLAIDFKGPLSSSSRNFYILVVVDEFSRFPFCFPCPNMSSQTVINCLVRLFTLCGIPGCIHSDNASTFVSAEFKSYLIKRGIAQSHSAVYHPAGNSQVERCNGVIWRAVRLALKTRNMPITQWERVLHDVLHPLRSLLCTSTNATPHELFFNFNRKSPNGFTLPAWLTKPGPVLLRNFVRASKNDDYVRQVQLTEANPTFARVRFPDGHESTVSLQDLAPCPSSFLSSPSKPGRPTEIGTNEQSVTDSSVLKNVETENENHPLPSSLNPEDQERLSPQPRRSARYNKGVPPLRYGDAVYY